MIFCMNANNISVDFFGICQRSDIRKAVRPAEALDKVIAAADRTAGHRGMRLPENALGDLLDRTVTPAGVKAQRLGILFTASTNIARSIRSLFGFVDLVHAIKTLDRFSQIFKMCSVPCIRIQDKDMSHM